MRPARLGWGALALWPTPVLAHSPVPGIEGFYLGLVHPYSTPYQLLLLASLGLLIGALPMARVRTGLLVFAAALMCGALLPGGLPGMDTLLCLTAFAACVLTALAPGRALPLALIVAAVGGWALGVVNLPDPGHTWDRVISLSGAQIGAGLGPFYVAGVTAILRERYSRPWVGIAFRVTAAWIGAIALIMAALGLAAPGAPA